MTNNEAVTRTQISEVEKLIQAEAQMKRSTLRGIAYGAIAGFLVGLGQMVFLGPTIWSMWGAAAIPIFNAGCWALIGSIIGCGGILASTKDSAEGKQYKPAGLPEVKANMHHTGHVA